jgi:hypothetical protein
MQDSDDKKPVSLFFQVPGKTAVEFYQLAAEHFGMKKGAKRKMFLKMLDDQLREQRIVQLKEEIRVLEQRRWVEALPIVSSTGRDCLGIALQLQGPRRRILIRHLVAEKNRG